MNTKINETGREYIAAQLASLHKNGEQQNLDAWVSEAEMRADNGNGCGFEIRSWDAASGRVEVINVPSCGFERLENLIWNGVDAYIIAAEAEASDDYNTASRSGSVVLYTTKDEHASFAARRVSENLLPKDAAGEVIGAGYFAVAKKFGSGVDFFEAV